MKVGMHRLLILAFAGLLPAHAAADEKQIALERISAVVTADWNDDGGFDRALLVESSEDTVDLLIYLSTGGNFTPMKLHTRASGIAWRGLMWGQQPELALSDKGSMLLHAMNEAIGRHRWTETRTIAFKDGAFIVAGYTYSYRDTIGEYRDIHCDVNLLTGSGVRNGKAFRAVQRATPVAKWTDALIPPACRPE